MCVLCVFFSSLSLSHAQLSPLLCSFLVSFSSDKKKRGGENDNDEPVSVASRSFCRADTTRREAADAVCQLQGTFLDNAHAGTGDAAASVVIRGGTVKFLGLEAALGFPGNGTTVAVSATSTAAGWYEMVIGGETSSCFLARARVLIWN